MKSIFNISQEYLQLTEALVEAGGEVTPELEQALVLNKEKIQVKGANYGYIVKQLLGDVAIIDAEIERLQTLKGYRTSAIERLKKTLSGAMKLHEIEEIKTPLMTINFRKSKAVEITDLKLIPAKYMVEKVSTAPDKTAIKKALEAGEEIHGATIVENQNLQIK